MDNQPVQMALLPTPFHQLLTRDSGSDSVTNFNWMVQPTGGMHFISLGTHPTRPPGEMQVTTTHQKLGQFILQGTVDGI